MPLPKEEIENRFSSHSAVSDVDVQEQIVGHQVIQEKFTELAQLLNRMLPDGRATSVCLTTLEDAAMWANKAHSGRYPVAGKLL